MELKYNKNNKTEYNNLQFEFKEEDLKTFDVNKIEITESEIIINETTELNLEFTIKGNFFIPCSVTRKEIKVPFITENVVNIDNYEEEFNKKVKINENTLEIFPIIWENVLVEIPMKVTGEEITNETLKGEGWEFVTEEKRKGNNPFESLKDLI